MLEEACSQGRVGGQTRQVSRMQHCLCGGPCQRGRERRSACSSEAQSGSRSSLSEPAKRYRRKQLEKQACLNVELKTRCYDLMLVQQKQLTTTIHNED